MISHYVIEILSYRLFSPLIYRHVAKNVTSQFFIAVILSSQVTFSSFVSVVVTHTRSANDASPRVAGSRQEWRRQRCHAVPAKDVSLFNIDCPLPCVPVGLGSRSRIRCDRSFGRCYGCRVTVYLFEHYVPPPSCRSGERSSRLVVARALDWILEPCVFVAHEHSYWRYFVIPNKNTLKIMKQNRWANRRQLDVQR